MSHKIPIVNLWCMLLQLWGHLSGRRRRQFVFVIGLTLVSALAEVVSLGAVLPFLGILTAPDLVIAHPIGERLARYFAISSSNQLVLPLTLAFVLMALSAAAVRLILMWAGVRLVFAIGADLSIEVYRRTLYQPYRVHVARNSSDIISGITSKVHSVVFGVLNPLLGLVSSTVLIVAIMSALLVIDVAVAAVAAIGFGSSYGVIALVSRRRLARNSRRMSCEETLVVKALQEGLGGIRDVLLDGTQSAYCDVYRDADHRLRRAQASNAFISQSPRYVMEALGMVLIAGLAYGLSERPSGIATALPVLGALAMGAQRMLPALQQAYHAWATVLGHSDSLRIILDLLQQPLPQELLSPAPPPLEFHHAIRVDNVRFRYSEDGPWVLDRLNLTIGKGMRLGIVGCTGSGKSTALDLLMGLIEPDNGRLLVDNTPVLGNRVRAWQRTIAHVPQSIYLADASLLENIAFGVPLRDIDRQRVRLAAQQAQIAEFIESRAGGYDVIVGERGIRLSGGQRQRIGIARALYKEASVLIFDEATSALDSSTEQSVMEAIDGLNRELTIVIIAHRLTTVRRCDSIVELERGSVVAQGTYDELLESSPTFRRLAGVGS